MLFKSNPDREAFHNVKNASPLFLKLLSIKPGEEIDISRADLPASYKGATTMVNYITNKYGLYYYVLKLTNPKGWRIKRVKDLEELKELSIFKLKYKHIENQPEQPNHNFSDADLAQKIDEIIALATRDAADLIPRGVTALRVAALATANNNFKNMLTDEELQGEESLAIAARNTSRGILESLIGNVRTMAQNIYGTGTPEYNNFSFEGMISLNDSDLSRKSKIFNRQAIKYAADLVSEGCDAAFLLAFANAVIDFDTKIDEAKFKGTERKEGTGARTRAGNANYTESERICNTAKDVYRETDPIKHDEYLMYPSPNTHSVEVELNVVGAIPQNLPLPQMQQTASTRVIVTATDNAMQLFGSTAPAIPPGPGQPLLDVAITTVSFSPEEFATATGLGTIGEFLNVRLVGIGPGHIKIRFTNLAD